MYVQYAIFYIYIQTTVNSRHRQTKSQVRPKFHEAYKHIESPLRQNRWLIVACFIYTEIYINSAFYIYVPTYYLSIHPRSTPLYIQSWFQIDVMQFQLVGLLSININLVFYRYYTQYIHKYIVKEKKGRKICL